MVLISSQVKPGPYGQIDKWPYFDPLNPPASPFSLTLILSDSSFHHYNQEFLFIYG